MNILVTIDDAYTEPLRVMLYSLLFNNQSRHIHIFLIYQRLSRFSLKQIAYVIHKMNASFTPIRVNDALFSDAPERSHITNATYLRLLAPALLPTDVDRILYLDADIIVDGSLDALYELPMENYYFAAVPDHLDTSDNNLHKRSIGMPGSAHYVCAGILLMNMEQLRKHMDLHEVYRLINRKGTLLTMQDQDIINLLYHRHIYLLDSIYGKEAWFYHTGDTFKMLAAKLFQKQKRPVIIHYLYHYKPWNLGYIGLYMDRYWHYARVFKKHRNYQTIKDNQKKRLIHEIMGYLGMANYK